MTEKQWHYVKEDKQVGPVPESRIAEMIKGGFISEDTLVWSPPMTDWLVVSAVPSFKRLLGRDWAEQAPRSTGTATAVAPPQRKPAVFQQPIPAVITSPNKGRHATITVDSDVPQVRPWVRYFARGFDMSILMWGVAFMAGFAWGFMSPEASLEPDLALFGIILVGTLVAESLCLSMFGTTPGKWLFNTHVRTNEGSKLSFGQAMSRTVAVWIKGLGLWVFSLITLIWSYNKLNNEGITSWDRAGGFQVIHKRIGIGRTMLIVVVWILLGAIQAFLEMAAAVAVAPQ
jgi:uncharacterized RDD family membrane protein YckC